MNFWKTLATLASYFSTLPWIPGWGLLKRADCIFAQAFGRNHFTDNELGRVLWRLRSQTRLDEYQTLLLLNQQGFDPGARNRALARFIRLVHSKRGVPIIAQWEVVCALFQHDPAWYLEHRAQIDCVWPPVEGYFATYHVKLLSQERMAARGCRSPLEVAHPAMVSRAVLTIWKTGVRPVVLPVSPLKFWQHELWVWDKNSVQPWTRSFLHWWKREAIGRVGLLVAHVLPFIPFRELAPKRLRQLIPGNWIRFTPPRRGVK